ncbi:MAG: hypothetical protein A2788_00795 [Candidatus Abawacabacteria bacterium RIFCSPHIGHO2_01_FULL_46_8]|uniref:Uncharacterized protein n=1 Tax=Candidatus Abawacabacteria bacterium RIFCSPHIGHO2_01_FULL_46_8 TaxID=1817815 RepID=A0A1F4XHJ6_9BACT|nr:MAG: hypothetical protein A2788_00795 [Candidatus Abawacabacteria bacterium RIFCSPHIGHO2_01_FULL_46_8]
MSSQIPIILQPLSRDLQLVMAAKDEAALAHLGTAICQHLSNLPPGTDFPEELVRWVRGQALNFFHLIPAATALDASATLKKLCPASFIGKEVLDFLPLHVAVAHFNRLQRMKGLSMKPEQILASSKFLLDWLKTGLSLYQAKQQALPGHLWQKLHEQLRELDKTGEAIAQTMTLLISLTPRPMGIVPNSNPTPQHTQHVLLNPPPFR